VRVVVGARSREAARAETADGRKVRWTADPFVRRAERAITRYLDASADRIDVPFDAEGATAFQRRVYEACRRIPRGETRTYAELAGAVGARRCARAAAGALAANPVPLLIPCHRVIRSDGQLGGFSAPGGVALKRKLLTIEGAPDRARAPLRRGASGTR